MSQKGLSIINIYFLLFKHKQTPAFDGVRLPTRGGGRLCQPPRTGFTRPTVGGLAPQGKASLVLRWAAALPKLWRPSRPAGGLRPPTATWVALPIPRGGRGASPPSDGLRTLLPFLHWRLCPPQIGQLCCPNGGALRFAP